MKHLLPPRASLLAVLIPFTPALAQRDLTELPDPSPQVQEASFQLAEGFEVNLFASDPMIAKPVQINWDARGRLWIVSSKVYPQIEPGQEAQDEILVLEDTDGDGSADKKTVFADGLLIPTGVLPTDGGAYVANSTEMLFMRDTDGDGRADEKQVILSGFGTEDTHHILHTFRGGPDGQIYMNQSIYIHSHVETPWGTKRLLGGGLWHFRPETRELGVLCNGFVNPWGHVFDPWGQSFVTDGAYGEGINYVFPGSVFATAPGAKRILKGMSPGQPKQCGLARLSGRHLPEAWRGQMVTNDFRGHRVNRFSISEDGSGYQARQHEDLIWTKHGGFRPIGVEMGPDGAIYIADWYNPIIQHGEVDFRDERRDQTHGRIWRITAKDRPVLTWPEIETASNESLLELLRAPEDLTRYHAKQQLRSRGISQVRPALESWIAALDPQTSDFPHLQLEALWIYLGLNECPPDLLKAVLASTDHRARAAAVRALYHWHSHFPDEALPLLTSAARDPHAQVRLEAVNSLRALGTADAFLAAMTVLDHPTDASLDFALWQTARTLETVWLPKMQAGSLTFSSNTQRIFALRAIENPTAIKPLVDVLGHAEEFTDEVDSILNIIADLGDSDDLTSVFAKALGSTGELQTKALEALNSAAAQRELKPQGDLATITTLLESDSELVRSLTCRVIGRWKQDQQYDTLLNLAKSDATPDSVYEASINGIRLFGDKSRASLQLLAETQKLGSDRRILAAQELAHLDLQQGAALAVGLLASAEQDSPAAQSLWTTILSIKEGPTVFAEALSEQSLPRAIAYGGLQKANSAGERAKPLVKALVEAGRLESVNQDLTETQMATLIDEVAAEGDPHRGEFIYRRQELQCTVCHALGGAGGKLGPDLISLGASAPVDYIVESLLAPNNKVKEGYHMTTIYTKDDRVLSGFVALEDDRQLVLRDAANQETTISKEQILKKEIASVSMMPPGLTDGLQRDEFIHLVRFLSELGKEGSFKVPPRRLVRRWRVLNFTDAIEEPVRKGDQRFYAQQDGLKEWLPAYSTVRGVLPINAIPAKQRWLNLVAPLHFELDVTTPGEVAVKLNAAEGLRAWVDEKEVFLTDARIVTELTTGRHVITLVLDLNAFSKPTLEAELIDVPGSTAAVQLVNGI